MWIILITCLTYGLFGATVVAHADDSCTHGSELSAFRQLRQIIQQSQFQNPPKPDDAYNRARSTIESTSESTRKEKPNASSVKMTSVADAFKSLRIARILRNGQTKTFYLNMFRQPQSPAFLGEIIYDPEVYARGRFFYDLEGYFASHEHTIRVARIPSGDLIFSPLVRNTAAGTSTHDFKHVRIGSDAEVGVGMEFRVPTDRNAKGRLSLTAGLGVAKTLGTDTEITPTFMLVGDMIEW